MSETRTEAVAEANEQGEHLEAVEQLENLLLDESSLELLSSLPNTFISGPGKVNRAAYVPQSGRNAGRQRERLELKVGEREPFNPLSWENALQLTALVRFTLEQPKRALAMAAKVRQVYLKHMGSSNGTTTKTLESLDF